MDRLMRARVLLAEAASLGITFDDLIAVAADAPPAAVDTPTVAEYVETVASSFARTQRRATAPTGGSWSPVTAIAPSTASAIRPASR
jgi:hypothetical protein